MRKHPTSPHCRCPHPIASRLQHFAATNKGKEGASCGKCNQKAKAPVLRLTYYCAKTGRSLCAIEVNEVVEKRLVDEECRGQEGQTCGDPKSESRKYGSGERLDSRRDFNRRPRCGSQRVHEKAFVNTGVQGIMRLNPGCQLWYSMAWRQQFP
jgi:hypothetical protein